MANPISERRRQRRETGPVLTEPGDPNFSPSMGSQAQVPAAAAQSRVFDNQRRATNTLAAANSLGYDTTTDDWEPIIEQAETGFKEDALSAIGTLVGWIDGPRQAINLMIQDIAGGDAGEGYRNPNFLDYWDTLWGGMEDQEGFEFATGLSPVSGSKTLDMFGWAEQESLGGRIARGVADFGLQVLTDPLTYVTFGLSGLGKKVALQAAESLKTTAISKVLGAKSGRLAEDALTAYERSLLHGADDITQEFLDDLTRKGIEFGDELPPDMQEAVARYLGRDENLWENLDEVALANRIHKDVHQPALARDFANMNSLAQADLPAYMTGGARISVPFTPKTLQSGIYIPGTQGLGRKLVGDPMRALSTKAKGLTIGGKSYSWLADSVKKGVTKMDQMAPLLRGMRDGKIEGWQWHIASTAIENMHNNVAKHTIRTEIKSQWDALAEQAAEAGLDLSDVGADIFLRLEGDNVADSVLEDLGRVTGLDQTAKQSDMGWREIYPELADSTDQLVTYMQQTMDSYHSALSVLDPEFADKFIRGYIPHTPTKATRELIRRLATTSSGNTGQGDLAEDIYAQILNAASRGGTAEPAMGATRHVGRKTGRLSTQQLTDDGVTLIDRETLKELGRTQPVIREGVVDPTAIETRYLSTPHLNELLGPIVEREAKKHGVPLPRDWDGKVFNENPIDVMLDYVDNMNDAVQSWSTIESLRASGLAFKHQTDLDIQQVIQNMYANVVNNASLVRTTHFGKPRVGETEMAPVAWLDDIVDPQNMNEAETVLSGGEVFLEGMDTPRTIRGFDDPQAFVDDIAEKGVEKPVIIEIYGDGVAQVLDGHHRIAAAKRAGIKEIPVQFRRGSNETYKRVNDVNVGHATKKEWMQPFHADMTPEQIKLDILNNPDNYMYHGTRRIDDETFEFMERGEDAVTRGGLTGDRQRAGEYVREQRPASPEGEQISPEGAGEWVLVFRKDKDLNDRLRREAQKGDIEEMFPNPEQAFTEEAVRPVGRYNPDEGLDSFQLMKQEPSGAPIDDLTTYDAHEVFDVTPWGAYEAEELSLLRGGPDQSHIPGVPKRVAIALQEAGIELEDLEDIADVRRLTARVNSTHPGEWADPAHTPSHFGTFDEPDDIGYKWRERTDADGTTTRVFGPEVREPIEGAGDGLGPRKPPKPLTREDPRVIVQINTTPGKRKFNITLPDKHRMNKAEVTASRKAALNYLDRAFFGEGGDLAGEFTDKGIQEIIDSGLDEFTADILHTYVRRKLNSFGRDTTEYLAKEPAEVFEARQLYNDWERALNDFIRGAAGLRDKDGKLVGPQNVQYLGDADVRNQLAELKRAALTLGQKGYDIAVDVMQDVEAYTGVKRINDYVNPEMFNLQGPAIGDLHIQTDMAEWLSLLGRNMGTIYTPEGVAAAKLAANETLKWWRAMATLPRPAFHIRNLVGGAWMNMNFGVKAQTMAEVSKYGIRFRNALANATGPAGIEQAFEALPAGRIRNAWREAWENNVLAGFATTEFSAAVTPQAMRDRWAWAKMWDVDDFALTRAGGKVMESVEDFLRMSLFMQHYDEAVQGSGKTAAAIVNAVHFDYSNLTPTETKLKSLIPFFVWTRRNLPLQIQTAVENPRYVQRYRAMLQAMDDNFGGNDPNNLEEADHFSAWAAGTNYKVNPGTPFWGRIMIDPDLPISDLLNIPNPEPGALIEYANQLLGPHVSSLVDINAQRDFGDVNAPAPFNLVLQGLAGVGFYDRTMDGDVRIPYYMRTLMETAVPFSREIADPLTGGPTDPGRQQRLGIKPDDNPLERSLKSVGSQLMGGLGIKLTTPSDTRSAAYRSNAELDEIIESLRLGGNAPPVGS